MESNYTKRPERLIKGEKLFDFTGGYGKRIEGYYNPESASGTYPYKVLYTEPDANSPTGFKYTLCEANNPCIFSDAQTAIHWIINERNNELFNKHNAWIVAQEKAAKESHRRKRKAA